LLEEIIFAERIVWHRRQMQTEGYVSLWASTETDAANVQAVFKVEYTEDGEWIPPPFAEAFAFRRFNLATREANVLTIPTASVRDAVSGFSSGAVIADRFAAAFGESLPSKVASIALLYDFQFSGSPTSAVINGSTWICVGCVSYRQENRA